MTDNEISDYEDNKWISKSEWNRIKKVIKNNEFFI